MSNTQTVTEPRAIVELRQKQDEKRSEWKQLWDAHSENMDHPQEVVERMRELNDEMTEVGKELDEKAARFQQAQQIDQAQANDRQPQRGKGFFASGENNDPRQPEARRESKSPGERFIESEEYKRWQKGVSKQTASVELDLHPGRELKAPFLTADSTFTQEQRLPNIVLVGVQRLTVADLLAQGQTTASRILFPREDAFVNAATTVAEGAAKPEAGWNTSEGEAPVRKIAVFTKVSDELFEDFPALRDYINERLPFMVRVTEEAQLLNGTGVAPQLTGILQTAGIQTQAKGADPTPDAIYKGMTKVRFTGFFEPSGVVFHPNDWQDVRLLRTADGMYIWGNPAEAGPERIWGLPVVVTTAMTENTALVGAFRLGAQVFYKGGLRLESTNMDQDDFIKNLVTIRAEVREALAVYTPPAFCTVTGI